MKLIFRLYIFFSEVLFLFFLLLEYQCFMNLEISIFSNKRLIIVPLNQKYFIIFVKT